MTKEASSRADAFHELKQVRAEALEHAHAARELAKERRRLIEGLIDEGYSQADVARELGVTRQAIQKMLSL